MSVAKQLSELNPKTFVLSLAGLLCAVFIFHTTSIWITTEREVVPIRKNGGKTLNFDVDNIAVQNVFGETTASSNSVAKTVEAQQTRNNDFQLQAIFESSQPDESRAIISVGTATAKTYTPGDEIHQGISINSIERNRVLLDTPRGVEALGFRAPALASASDPVQRTISFDQPATIEQAHTTSEPDQAKNQNTLSNKKLDSVRQRLQQLREQSRTQ